MWADHFEFLGTPFDSSNFDNDFCHRVTTRVHDVLQTCIEDLSGALCEPLEYEEVAHVSSRLKPGVSPLIMNIFATLVPPPPLPLESSILFVQGLLLEWFCVST